jgi:hypothetical protein
MKPVEGKMMDRRSVYRRRWSMRGAASRGATTQQFGGARGETAGPFAPDPAAGAEVRPRAELPAWNDALSRVVSLLGTLQEHVGKIDAADVPVASAEPSNMNRGQLLRDIERAQRTARNAQRRVAEALGTASSGQDAAKP